VSPDFERALLRSATSDVPPAGGADRLLASLAGANAAAVDAAIARAGGPAAVDALRAAATSPCPPDVVGWKGGLLGAKALTLALVVGAAASIVALRGPAVATRAPAPPAAPAFERSRDDVAYQPLAPSARAPAPTAEPALRVPTAAERPGAPPTGASARGVSPSTEVFDAPPSLAEARAAGDLPRELALLDTARRLIASGNSAGADAALTRYLDEFPGGTLVPEARALEVDVAALEGDVPRVRRLAAEFLARHPETPHATRVRARLDAATPAR